MTKAHYKLVAKLYSAYTLYNTECAFEPNNILDHTYRGSIAINRGNCKTIRC